MRTTSDQFLDKNVYSLPLRREVSSALHFLHARRRIIKAGLDVGFTNAGVSQFLRQACGGYWMTVELSLQRQALVASALGAETVLVSGGNGELPFEDKQFDVVVVAHGALPADDAAAAAMIRECHRVLRTGGDFILTVEYRKSYGLAAALNRQRVVADAGGRYSETDMFRLLRDGFDVLGFRFTCRFWVQLVRQWLDRRRETGAHGVAGGWLRFLYSFAHLLDAPLALTRGYQMTVYGRRKGWREKKMHVLSGNAPVSSAMLFDPRRDGRQVSLDRFSK
jgi:SAM-dependent methyltransferase